MSVRAPGQIATARLNSDAVDKLRRIAGTMTRGALSRHLRVSNDRVSELLQDGGPALPMTIDRITMEIDRLYIETEPRS